MAVQLYYPTFDLIYILKGKETRGGKSPSHSQVAAKQIVFQGHSTVFCVCQDRQTPSIRCHFSSIHNLVSATVVVVCFTQ
jgi:hypothetical protein